MLYRGNVHPSPMGSLLVPQIVKVKEGYFIQHTHCIGTCIENCQKETNGVYTYCTGSPGRSRDRRRG